MENQQGSGASTRTPQHDLSGAESRVVEHAADILGLSFDVLLSFSLMLQNQRLKMGSRFQPFTLLTRSLPHELSNPEKRVVEHAADILEMPFDTFIVLSMVVQPQCLVTRGTGIEPESELLSPNQALRDSNWTHSRTNLHDSGTTIDPALLGEDPLSSETTSSAAETYTPQSSESQSSLPEKFTQMDQEAGGLLSNSFSTSESLALEKDDENADINNLSLDLDWLYEAGIGWPHPAQRQQPGGFPDLDIQPVLSSIENEIPMSDWLLPNNHEVVETSASTPQHSTQADVIDSGSLTSQNVPSSFQPSDFRSNTGESDRFNGQITPEIVQPQPIQPEVIQNASDAVLTLPRPVKPPTKSGALIPHGPRVVVASSVEKVAKTARKPRRNFDLDEKSQTACTRKLGVCVRCRMQKTRCLPNPNCPEGDCLGCLSDSTIIKVPCLRKKLPDARFTPAKDSPEPYWTTRWASMEDIGAATDVLRVRRIIPLPGVDSLTRTWLSESTGERFFHQTAPWAIENMVQTAGEVNLMEEQHIEDFIKYYIKPDDRLMSETYWMAYKHATSSKVDEGSLLLRNVLRLWVASRRQTKPQRVIGEETLDMQPQTLDPAREALVVRPLVREVRAQLDNIVAQNKPENWLTIYLAMFILLHNCSMLTGYYHKKAKNLRLQAKYHAIAILEELHFGVNILLTYYHYVNKGALCFATGYASLRDIKRLQLDDRQSNFLTSSVQEVKRLEPSLKKIREENIFHHDYYFISQLYDLDWTLPTSTLASVQ